MSRRLFFCLLLLCASFPLMARDIRMMGANGDSGSCQDTSSQAAGSQNKPSTSKAVADAAKTHAKPGTTHAAIGGGDGVSDVRPPRWHSFLPGMFR